MLETSARLLRLLSLMQTPRDWTGPQLAERLGVTARTVRADVERLRTLGYPVTAAPGRGGGYRLGAGAALPPLLLDDEEAIAVAVGLREAAAGGVAGIEESSLRALSKLEQVLPSRLRYRINALHKATATLHHAGASVAPAVLMSIADAVRDRHQLRFDYDKPDGETDLRRAEPYLLVHTRGYWYLAAFDNDRRDWRTFRVDRIRLRTPDGPSFAVRPPPPDGLVAHVERSVGSAVWQYRCTVTVHAPSDRISAKLPSWAVVEPLDEASCLAHLGSDNPRTLAFWLGALDADFDVGDNPDLADAVRSLGERYLRAAPAQVRPER